MLKTILHSGKDKRNVIKINEEGSLYTIDVSDVDEKLLFQTFSNDTGSNMAVNAAITTPTNIWDGTGIGDTGTGDFTFTAAGGATATENAVSNHSGTNGLSVNMPDKGRLDFTTLTATDMTSSQTLQFWIQPQTGWVIGSILEIELRYLGVRYGIKLNVLNYMADEVVGTWKLVSIPLADFGAPIGLVDEIRFKAKGSAKVFYFDDFEHGAFGGAGVNPIYTLAPSPLERYRIQKLIISITDGSAATGTRQSWDSTGFGNLAALTSGILFTIERNWGDEISTLVFTTMADILTFAEQINETVGVNVTTLNINISTERILLNGGTDDKMKITIRDDLSGLIALTVSAQGITKDLSTI